MELLFLLLIPLVYVLGGWFYCALIRNTIGVGLNRLLFVAFTRMGEITLTEEKFTAYLGYKQVYGNNTNTSFCQNISYLSEISDYAYLQHAAGMVDSFDFFKKIKNDALSIYATIGRVFKAVFSDSRELPERHRQRLRFSSD